MKILSKALSVLIIFGAVVGIILMAYTLYYSINYWVNNIYIITDSLDKRLYTIGLLVAIVVGLSQLIIGIINSMGREFRILLGKKEVNTNGR